MLLYICVKFHENILNGFLSYRADTILQQTDRWTDRWTDDQGKNNMSPNPTGGDIIQRKSAMFSGHVFDPGIVKQMLAIWPCRV